MDEGVDPKNLGQQMVTAIDEYAQVESLANPEIRTLFIDWMEDLEEEEQAGEQAGEVEEAKDV